MANPPTSPDLRRRYDERQRDVIDTCAKVFAQRGYHATSIPDLVEATGLARGGLYHYIGSKEDALFRIFDELMDPLLERVRALLAEPGSAEQHLRRLAREWMAHVEDHRWHMTVFQQERHTIASGPRWSEVRRARREFEALLAGVLDRGVAEGDFAIPDAGLTALAFLGMVNYSPVWFRPRGRLSAEAIADGFCDVLLEGIRAGS